MNNTKMPPNPTPKKRVVVEDGEVKLSADVVRDLADGVRKMRVHAKDKLVVLLLHDATGIARRDIQIILDTIPELERTYYKVKP